MPSSILTKLFLALAVFAAAEKEDFVIYEVNSHTPEELLKATQGIVNGARLSTLGQKIIIYGTRSQREKVLEIFQQIDHRLQNYLVSVRVAKRGAGKSSAQAVEGSVGTGNVGVASKSGVLKRKGGGTIGVSGENGSVSASAESSEDNELGDSGQQLTVMDGGSAKIFSGNALFPTAVNVSVRSLGKVGARVEIRQADTSAIGEQKLVTQINVPLNEWRTIGGIQTKETGKNGELLGSSKRASSNTQDIQIKVQVASEN